MLVKQDTHNNVSLLQEWDMKWELCSAMQTQLNVQYLRVWQVVGRGGGGVETGLGVNSWVVIAVELAGSVVGLVADSVAGSGAGLVVGLVAGSIASLVAAADLFK